MGAFIFRGLRFGVKGTDFGHFGHDLCVVGILDTGALEIICSLRYNSLRGLRLSGQYFTACNLLAASEVFSRRKLVIDFLSLACPIICFLQLLL